MGAIVNIESAHQILSEKSFDGIQWQYTYL